LFDIQSQLFEGQDIRFGPIDHDKDAEIESKWTHDSGRTRQDILREGRRADSLSMGILREEWLQMQNGENE
jgi:hypothetical protein